MLWQAISAAVESLEEQEHRRSLVRGNSRLVVREAGFSEVRGCGIDWV